MKEKDVIRQLKIIFGADNVKRFAGGAYLPAGVPDCYIITNVVDFWIEIKINKTKLTRPQENWLKKTKSYLLKFDTDKKICEIKKYNIEINEDAFIEFAELLKKLNYDSEY